MRKLAREDLMQAIQRTSDGMAFSTGMVSFKATQQPYPTWRVPLGFASVSVCQNDRLTCEDGSMLPKMMIYYW